MWIVFSLLAALCAAVVVTLSKAGIRNVEPSFGFAVQSIVIVTFSWAVVWWQGNLGEVWRVEGRAWGLLLAAGVVTCLSSLFMFRALKLGDAARVGSLDRVSLVLVILFAALFLGEQISWKVILGAVLMAAGALVIALTRES